VLAQLARWGSWPARIAGAVLVFLGVYIVINAQVALAARPNPAAADDPLLNLDLYLQTLSGAVMVAFGGLVALLSWLTRRRNRAAAIAGMVGCFFLAGLTAAYALAANLSGELLAGALVTGACLLIAGGTALAGRRESDGEAKAHG
jgi:peptidoglycan/LPS O-acetylase OafA/YrhL